MEEYVGKIIQRTLLWPCSEVSRSKSWREFTIWWNEQTPTNRTNPNNKQDIIICDNEKGTCVSIDTAIWGDRNALKKEAEKILKYKLLTIEMQRMWSVKPKMIPVMTGATGNVSKSLKQYLSNIPGKREIKEIQKNSHIGHCTRTWRSTNVEVRKCIMGNNVTRSTNCKYRTAATLRT